MPDTTDSATADSDAGRHAAEQAKEYASIFAPIPLTFDDKTTMEIPCNPEWRLFEDEECLRAYDRLMFERESYDCHEIELPERKVKDDDGNEMVLPAETRKGAPKVPFRKGNELVDDDEARLVRTVLGDAKYQLLCSKTINGRKAGYADVQRAWSQRGYELMERQRADSKSAPGSVDLAPVSAPDSQ